AVICTASVVSSAPGCADGAGSPLTASNGQHQSDPRRAVPVSLDTTDEDGDGLGDATEDALAEKFAPIIYHGENETAFPVSVDWWLARTHLSLIDADS